jgi:predicted unusual protein kinase regulating ubiquinone biosynthesis (AarF/ABC1/UbiB family)
MIRFLSSAIMLFCVAKRVVAFSPLSRGIVPTAAIRSGMRVRPSSAASPVLLSRDEVSPTEYNMDVPYREAAYDPVAGDAFFRQRPLKSFTRLVQLLQLSSGFVFNILVDKALKREDDMVDERSKQLLELVTKLGPTFVKVGQLLSIRTDLLPAPYVAGLVQLQDAVPPFSGDEGRRIIERELGVLLNDTFSELSFDPVASASIGQVYKARMRSTGEELAIKVQRPDVLYNIALDLFLMREFLVPMYLKIIKDVNTDLVGLVDAWGTGFVKELDYRLEAAATTAFSEAMQQRGLGSVTAPEVVPELSSVHVLTTKWVDGEKLAASGSEDVPRLCGVALNAYLTMLLDTGSLHCDPHPGNLLRTSDGRLCILDFGMCLDVPQDLQLSLLEFIANLQGQNYEQLPDDLVKLGFVPKDKLDELRASGLTYGLAQTVRLAAEGGGPKGAMERLVAENKAKYRAADGSELPTKERQRRFREDWKKEMAKDSLGRTGTGTSTTADITQKLEQMQQENANVFAIPEYFIYMSRAFATLEGIGLSSDSNYSILSECFPYLAKRLLSDNSPRAQGALRTLLYGTGDELNLSKLQEITAGLETYTTSTSSVESSRGASDEGRNIAAEQLAAVLLSEDENYVQSLVLREAAVALDATLRDSVAQLRRLAPQIPIPPNQPRALLNPVTLPLELIQATLELQDVDARDAQRLENVRILTDLARRAAGRNGGGSGGITGGDMSSLAREAAIRRTALTRIGLRFGSTLASTQAERLRERQRNEGGELSPLALRLASDGAETFERLAASISFLEPLVGANTPSVHSEPIGASHTLEQHKGTLRDNGQHE